MITFCPHHAVKWVFWLVFITQSRKLYILWWRRSRKFSAWYRVVLFQWIAIRHNVCIWLQISDFRYHVITLIFRGHCFSGTVRSAQPSLNNVQLSSGSPLKMLRYQLNSTEMVFLNSSLNLCDRKDRVRLDVPEMWIVPLLCREASSSKLCPCSLRHRTTHSGHLGFLHLPADHSRKWFFKMPWGEKGF